MDDLIEYVESLPSDRLARLIALRPDSRRRPEPQSVAELAVRLSEPGSIEVALIGLNRPQLQLAEVIAALGSGCTRVELAASVGVDPDDPGLADALLRLAECAIAWPYGPTIRVVRLDWIWRHPLQLGSGLAVVLRRRRINDLREIARKLGIRESPHKETILDSLATWLGTSGNVRNLVADAPKATRDLLMKLAVHGPFLFDYAYSFPRGTANPMPATWAVERGLLAGDGTWGAPLEMPREIAIALRGENYRLPFDPIAPAVPTGQVAPEVVERESAAAASAAIRRMGVLLELSTQHPVAVLKNGGVGVRELRRVGKHLAEDADNVRLWLELAGACGLLTGTAEGLIATDEYDRWREAQPADQLVELLSGWRLLLNAPLGRAPDGSARRPAFEWRHDSSLAPVVRAALLDALASVPVDAAVRDAEALIPLVSWRCPLAADSAEDLAGLVTALWREAELLGVTAHSALTDLGRATAAYGEAGDESDARDELARLARKLLPPAEDTVRLQADLTAVVVGTPSGQLAALLDEVADRESSDGAWTWRFSAGSVRRALDAGASADQLLARLRSIAVGAQVPQPLEYLVGDVSRRHGLVQVRAVGCCLRCDDPALLAEILRSRSLAALGLTRLAPTILASPAPMDVTLTALRAAGYAPTGENPDGTRALEHTRRMRAESRRRTQSEPMSAAELDDLLDELLDEVPDELLDEMAADLSSDELPPRLVSWLEDARRGAAASLSAPDELARRLATARGRHNGGAAGHSGGAAGRRHR